VEGRRGDGERKGGGKDKEKERGLSRECCGVQKKLKIDPYERLYLFKRMTYVRQHQAGR